MQTPDNSNAAKSIGDTGKSQNQAEVTLPGTASNPKKKTAEKSSVPDNSSTSIEKDPSEATGPILQPDLYQEKGGEWELLTNKLKNWVSNNGPSNQLGLLLKLSLALVALIAILVILKIYSVILGVVGKFPLAPRLFEFAGVIWLTKFFITKLAPSEERQKVFSQLQSRWVSFLGESNN